MAATDGASGAGGGGGALAWNARSSEAQKAPSFYMLQVPEARPVMAIVRLDDNAILPSKFTNDAVGFDLYALETTVIEAMKMGLISTGIRATPPSGHYLRIAGRSSLTLQGFLVQSGVIDPDYTGEIKVMIFNANDSPFICHKGNRIAQMIPEKFASNIAAVVVSSSSLAASDASAIASGARGDRGFGSSGH